jgi:hypothetical protein
MFHRQLPFNTEATWSIGQPLELCWSPCKDFLYYMFIAAETVLIYHNIVFKLLCEAEFFLKTLIFPQLGKKFPKFINPE